ncbi:hypothetical protein DPMN_192601 [Dreissena polymorpha]|uniref:Uncharacterized protein n=1 Tax=Dreissena polymorpha TaxID=45954 RepID=A0A9D4BFT9_DREPO|nr:hypothetical protein DPMN_192601 [Dreissena polymorpha]
MNNGLNLIPKAHLYVTQLRYTETDPFCAAQDIIRTNESCNRSSIFFLKVKGLSFSITKEGGCGGVGVGTGDGLGKRPDLFSAAKDFIRTNVLTKFYGEINSPPPGGHFHEDWTINVILNRTINVASRVKNVPPLGDHNFQATGTIFELVQDIIRTNLLTKFHDDWTINVASRLFKRYFYSHIKKQAMCL